MMAARNASRAGQWALLVAAIVFVLAVGSSFFRKGETPVAPSTLPAAARGANQPATVDALKERADAAPKDAGNWAALGEALFTKNRFDEAAKAHRKATELEPDRAQYWSAFGEALVMGSLHDPMPKPALVAFRKALSLDPKDARSRYFNAVARDLTGDHQGALDDWIALLKETPSGAPWQNDLRRTIDQVARINRIDVAAQLASIAKASNLNGPDNATDGRLTAGAALPGPNPEQIRAAASLTPRQQDAMAQQMVAQLETKLRANPRNPEGWVMLIRSRKTLGQMAKASQALADAIAANPGVATRLQREAAALGVVAGK